MEGRESVKGEEAMKEGSECERRGKKIVEGETSVREFYKGRLRMEEEQEKKKGAGEDAESGNGNGGKSDGYRGNRRG